MSNKTLLFSCSKCINKIPTDHAISNTYNQCDCDITSDDYDAYIYMNQEIVNVNNMTL